MEQAAQVTAKPLKAGDSLPTITRLVTTEKMVEFERVVWDRGRNSHSDPEAAKHDGLSRPIASGQNQMAFLHELLERNFGDAWVYGGKISVRYIHPVYAGDRITPHAIVTEVSEAAGKPRVMMSIWCENQDGQKTAAGTASAGLPSGSRSWLESDKEHAS
jgi:acyl dehydratase